MRADLNSAVSPGKANPAQRDTMVRLLNSKTFASAPRLRAVIEYLLQTMEDGTSNEITEQSIGQAVFERPAGYNVNEDNIVRVTVRHLRSRLEEFYQVEGQSEIQILVIPKGKYVPTFASRQAAASSAEEIAAHVSPALSAAQSAAEVTQNVQAVPPSDRSSLLDVNLRRAWLRVVFCAFGILLAFCAGYTVRSATALFKAGHGGLLGSLCGSGSRLLVVVVDTNLQLYRSVSGKQVLLDDYIKRQYGNDPSDTSDSRLASVMAVATDSNNTNVPSAIVAADVQRALVNRNVEIKHPHSVTIREFQNDENVLVLGGPWSNPWGQLFEKRLNFRLLPVASAPATSQIHNEKPQPGEPADYIPHWDGNLNVSYVRIAILPNFNGAGRVFVIGATSTEALEAGGDFLLSDDSLASLKTQLHVKSLTGLPPLELVLEVRGFESVPGTTRIVAKRVAQNP